MTETHDVYFPDAHLLQVEFLDTYAGPGEFGPAHRGDAGIDLYATEDVTIPTGEWKLIKCGLKIAVPAGCEGQIRSKSGRSLKDGLVVLNSPGTIDEGYRGEIMVIAHNVNVLTEQDWLDAQKAMSNQPMDSDLMATTTERFIDQMIYRMRRKDVYVQRGEKVAQLVIAKYERPPVRSVSFEGAVHTDRGEGGFGSTGV